MPRLKPWIRPAIAVLLMTTLGAALGQTFGNGASFTAAQVDRAAALFTHGEAMQPLRTMDEVSGVRGEDTWVSPELPSHSTWPFATQADRELQYLACRSSSIVTGTLLDSQARINSHGDMIITVARFRVDDTVKAAPDIAPGSTITVIREGGEVTDQGERLRLRVLGRPDFVRGQDYWLMLTAAPGLPAYLDAPFLTVRDAGGWLYPSTPIDGIPDATPASVVKQRMRQLQAAFPCT